VGELEAPPVKVWEDVSEAQLVVPLVYQLEAPLM
jgi:hypothetical protein